LLHLIAELDYRVLVRKLAGRAQQQRFQKDLDSKLGQVGGRVESSNPELKQFLSREQMITGELDEVDFGVTIGSALSLCHPSPSPHFWVPSIAPGSRLDDPRVMTP
jgi:hypothetical protein